MKTLTLNEASSSLGRIAEEAFDGETFLIERNGQFLILKKAESFEPLEKLDPASLNLYYENSQDAAFEERICAATQSNTLED